MEDGERVRRYLAGDPAALTALVIIYQPYVYRLARRAFGQHEAAEDVVQETWLRAVRSLASFDQAKSFKTWLLAVARSCVIDEIRRRKCRSRAVEHAPRADSINHEGCLLDPHALLQAKRRLHSVGRAVSGLAPDVSRIIFFRFGGYTYPEIANEEGLGVSTAKNRFRKGCAEIQLELEEAS